MVIDSSEALNAARGNAKMTTKKTSRVYRIFFIGSPFHILYGFTEFDIPFPACIGIEEGFTTN
jgi:hypothetical protein